MEKRIIVAGFGGQGVLLIGQLIAYAGMLAGKEVSWMPSYGPEMRGGSANCAVVVSYEPVASPKVEEADVVVAMNRPSMELFEDAAARRHPAVQQQHIDRQPALGHPGGGGALQRMPGIWALPGAPTWSCWAPMPGSRGLFPRRADGLYHKLGPARTLRPPTAGHRSGHGGGKGLTWTFGWGTWSR